MSGQCVLCGNDASEPWGSENGFDAVRCNACGLVYLDPWPDMAERDKALAYGEHQGERLLRTNTSYRRGAVAEYAKNLDEIYGSGYFDGREVAWLDIGCGYGEFLETLAGRVAPGSVLKGSEPNQTKQASARARGLDVAFYDLDELEDSFTHVSMLNVFSHLPDPTSFLEAAARCLRPGGELLLETGNGGDVLRRDFPGQLFFPDHLIFGGRKSLEMVIGKVGLELVSVDAFREPKLTVINVAKDLVKRVVRRDHNPVRWTGPYRDLWFRARKVV